MKTKILVIDNEMPIRKAFVKMLEHFIDDSYEIFEAEGVKTGKFIFDQIQPHILYLDIELDDGSGFDLLNLIDYSNTQLIFTTAHNQYAIRAFEYSAVNYLMKPISPSALQKTLAKAKENIGSTEIVTQVKHLLNHIQNPQVQEQKIVLKDAAGIYFVLIQDILYCEADGPYTRFCIKDDATIIVSKNLKEYEDLLLPYGFARCHHGYLVNLRKIKTIDRGDGNTIILENGSQIPVSYRKKEEILQLISGLFLVPK
ncbi:MAG: response regulator transcription factor [Saprospiraceae bacterium]|nr:response regulator transcription factor [Saprospiraceae bacterium]